MSVSDLPSQYEFFKPCLLGVKVTQYNQVLHTKGTKQQPASRSFFCMFPLLFLALLPISLPRAYCIPEQLRPSFIWSLSRETAKTMKTPAKEKGQVLVDAVKVGDSKEVAKLLAQDDIDVNCEMLNGTTPLNIAIACTHVHIVKDLIKVGADVHAPNKTGLTPLMVHKVNSSAATYSSILIWGVDWLINGFTSIEGLLRAAGASLSEEQCTTASGEQLRRAVYQRSADEVDTLIALNADVNFMNRHGGTALSYAVERGPDAKSLGGGVEDCTSLAQSGCKPKQQPRPPDNRSIPRGN